MNTPLSAPEAGSRLDHLIDETAASHRPISINGKNHEAVLISADDWRSIEEALYLHQFPGLVESIQAAREEPDEQATALKDLEW